MARITGPGCAPDDEPPPPPPPPDSPPAPCFTIVRHATDPMTWVVGPFPASWVAPFTIDWGDGHVEAGSDGEDAHQYALEGTYVVRGTDGQGRTCTRTVSVPIT